jgi:type II secretory pathway predicted ATPase ExeA
MYESFYGLRERAFKKTPDPRYLFLGESYEEALAQLQFAVEEMELALLTGEVGSGKTLLSRALVDKLGERYEIGMVLNPRLTPRQFLKTAALELGIESPRSQIADLMDQLYARLLELDGAGRAAVLIVDEAHLIPDRATFEEIRLLTNFQLDDRNLIAILLIGQPELRDRLRHRAYRALTQRIGAHFHLRPLTLAETSDYVRHRLQVAGAARAIFDEAALERLHLLSGGVPRVLNHLATQALIEGMVRGVPRVDVASVEAAFAGQEFLERSADAGRAAAPARGATKGAAG